MQYFKKLTVSNLILSLTMAFALVASPLGISGSALKTAEAQAQTSQAYYSCYTFSSNLTIGSTGTEVSALHYFLSREGFSRPNTWSSNTITTNFDEQTASLVTAFQEKYRSETLSPLNISHGTGYVGQYTRSKLNNLYSCNGGGSGNTADGLTFTTTPIKTVFDQNENIVFTINARNATGYEKVLTFPSGCQTNYTIGSFDSLSGQMCTAIYGTIRIPAYGNYSWTMTHSPNTYRFSPGTYSLRGRVAGYGDSYVSITITGNSGGGTGTGTNQPLVISPNGGEQLRRGTYSLLQWQMPNVAHFQAQAVDVNFISQPYYSGGCSYNCGTPSYYNANSYSNSTCPIGQTCAYTGTNTGNVGTADFSHYNPGQYPQYTGGYHPGSQTYNVLRGSYLSSFNWYVGSTPYSWSGIPSGQYLMQVCLTGTSVCDTSNSTVDIY